MAREQRSVDLSGLNDRSQVRDADLPAAPKSESAGAAVLLRERSGPEPASARGEAASGETGPSRGAGEGTRTAGLTDRVVQTLRFATLRAGEALAFRVLRGEARLDAGGALSMAPGARVSLDTYLNSFYENYWAEHAPAGELTLRLFGSGEVEVEARRQQPDGTVRRVARASVLLDGEHGAEVTIPAEPHRAISGRVYVTIAAAERALVIGGRFEAGTAPLRDVRLGIGLCTFNREAMLADNLERIVRSSYYEWARPAIVIVNQGKPFTSRPMLDLLARHAGAIRVIEQANFGGAGGFTRAAMEIVRAGESSHVLFMDDDIEIDPDVLIPTHAFAARAVKTLVVGGAMLDLYRASTMYEAGTIVGADNILRAVLHDKSLTSRKTLGLLSREVPCHFNGWWYCAIPAQMFREHGLPLPVFIRGDDMEYGTRLLHRGVRTVSLPPVSVWHEPFYSKAPGWQLYYDLRNRLIYASCYEDFVRLDSSGVILRRLIDSLLKHNYMTAALVIQAVEDFLAGPETLDEPMDAIHARVTALTAANAPGKLDSAVGLSPMPWRAPVSGPLRAPTLALGLAKLLRGQVAHPTRPDLVFTDQWHPWMTMGVAQYAHCDRGISYLQVYRYDREKLRGQLREGLAVWRRYRREAPQAAARWRAAQAELASWERWDKLLGLRADAA